jgi:hypothetical protein
MPATGCSSQLPPKKQRQSWSTSTNGRCTSRAGLALFGPRSLTKALKKVEFKAGVPQGVWEDESSHYTPEILELHTIPWNFPTGWLINRVVSQQSERQVSLPEGLFSDRSKPWPMPTLTFLLSLCHHIVGYHDYHDWLNPSVKSHDMISWLPC